MSDKLKFVPRFRYQLPLPAQDKPKFVGHFHGVVLENSQNNRPPILPDWKDRWPVTGCLSKVLDDQSTPTVPRPTVPPNGEWSAIVITIQAVVLYDHPGYVAPHSSTAKNKSRRSNRQAEKRLLTITIN